MRRAFSASMLTLLAATLAWAGKEPWKSKPYQQWNSEDLQEILYQSPWSHEVLIERTWVPYVNKDLPAQPVNRSSRPVPSSGGTAAQSAQGGEAHFFVSWVSSRVMRAAMARRDVLGSRRSEAEAYKDVDRPLPDYWIAVAGTDMTPFQKVDEAFLQAHVFLQLKRTKQKILPSKVTYERGPDGQSVTMVAIYFPNKTSAGEPSIPPEEKIAQFTCPIGNISLQANFEIQKMADEKGPDL